MTLLPEMWSLGDTIRSGFGFKPPMYLKKAMLWSWLLMVWVLQSKMWEPMRLTHPAFLEIWCREGWWITEECDHRKDFLPAIFKPFWKKCFDGLRAYKQINQKWDRIFLIRLARKMNLLTEGGWVDLCDEKISNDCLLESIKLVKVSGIFTGEKKGFHAAPKFTKSITALKDCFTMIFSFSWSIETYKWVVENFPDRVCDRSYCQTSIKEKRSMIGKKNWRGSPVMKCFL